MSDDLKSAVAAALPGWEPENSGASHDSKNLNWSAKPDQTGVDFEDLRRTYLPKQGSTMKGLDAVRVYNSPNASPPVGTVQLSQVRTKTSLDERAGSKTVVYNLHKKSIVGAQG